MNTFKRKIGNKKKWTRVTERNAVNCYGKIKKFLDRLNKIVESEDEDDWCYDPFCISVESLFDDGQRVGWFNKFGRHIIGSEDYTGVKVYDCYIPDGIIGLIGHTYGHGHFCDYNIPMGGYFKIVDAWTLKILDRDFIITINFNWANNKTGLGDYLNSLDDLHFSYKGPSNFDSLLVKNSGTSARQLFCSPDNESSISPNVSYGVEYNHEEDYSKIPNIIKEYEDEFIRKEGHGLLGDGGYCWTHKDNPSVSVYNTPAQGLVISESLAKWLGTRDNAFNVDIKGEKLVGRYGDKSIINDIHNDID